MDTYTCPVCHQNLPRDLIRFLDHADQHVIDAIKQKHPEWVDETGLCEKCVDYYKRQLRGENLPGPCG